MIDIWGSFLKYILYIISIIVNKLIEELKESKLLIYFVFALLRLFNFSDYQIESKEDRDANKRRKKGLTKRELRSLYPELYKNLVENPKDNLLRKNGKNGDFLFSVMQMTGGIAYNFLNYWTLLAIKDGLMDKDDEGCCDR